jgi:monovalent cation:H+ antiporter, CPA1 family
VLFAILAVLVSRAVVVYGLSLLLNRFTDPVPFRWQHVLLWGGLRGGVSLALALSLPAALGSDRELLRVMTFGVVLFTLIVQGATMRPLLQRLGLVAHDSLVLDYQRRHARLTAMRNAERQLEDMHAEGLLSTPSWEQLSSKMAQRVAILTEQVRDALHANPRLQVTDMQTAQRELLRVQRGALMRLRSEGIISDEVFQELTAEVDAELTDDSLSDPTVDVVEQPEHSDDLGE